MYLKKIEKKTSFTHQYNRLILESSHINHNHFDEIIQC